jgi:hypothetical protein
MLVRTLEAAETRARPVSCSAKVWVPASVQLLLRSPVWVPLACSSAHCCPPAIGTNRTGVASNQPRPPPTWVSRVRALEGAPALAKTTASAARRRGSPAEVAVDIGIGGQPLALSEVEGAADLAHLCLLEGLHRLLEIADAEGRREGATLGARALALQDREVNAPPRLTAEPGFEVVPNGPVRLVLERNAEVLPVEGSEALGVGGGVDDG